MVALTPDGKELIEVVVAASLNRVDELVRPLEQDERDQLAGLLEKWSVALGL